MKNFKKIMVVAAVVSVLGAAGIAYAVDIKTQADITAGLTGKSVTDVTKERAEGKTYGTIAKEAGKLDEFKTQMLERRKAVLDKRVKEGEITQLKSDEIYNAIKNNQATCDGTGNAKIGKNYGARFGNGQGAGLGRGIGEGRGSGNGGCSGAGCGMGNNQ